MQDPLRLCVFCAVTLTGFLPGNSTFQMPQKKNQQTAKEKSCSLLHFTLMANPDEALQLLAPKKKKKNVRCKSTEVAALKSENLKLKGYK